MRDIIAFQTGRDVWSLSLTFACAVVRGWLLDRASQATQEELDKQRIELGYMQIAAAEHIKHVSTDDKLAMARKFQEELQAQREVAERGPMVLSF